ncbi:MAG: hypothetical protein KF770_22965 [Anaerolineae bacterium]|nr:hypothetical protein [Anaerolineae bacterium]
MSDYRTLDEISVEYLVQRPEELQDFVAEIFAEYAQDGDSVALVSALQIVARAVETANFQEQ